MKFALLIKIKLKYNRLILFSKTMLTLKDLEDAAEYVGKNCKRTPTLKNVQQFFDDCLSSKSTKLHLKMENMQISGSFKMRGVTNQLYKIQPTLKPGQRLVTFSGGNYGKAFAMQTKALKIPSLVVMSNRVPSNRVDLIRSFGADVELVDSADLVSTVQKRGREENSLYVDPFDDYRLIAAYGSIGFEILEDVPDIDTVLVPCGGGGRFPSMQDLCILQHLLDFCIYTDIAVGLYYFKGS